MINLEIEGGVFPYLFEVGREQIEDSYRKGADLGIDDPVVLACNLALPNSLGESIIRDVFDEGHAELLLDHYSGNICFFPLPFDMVRQILGMLFEGDHSSISRFTEPAEPGEYPIFYFGRDLNRDYWNPKHYVERSNGSVDSAMACRRALSN